MHPFVAGGGGSSRKFSIRIPFMCKPYSIFQEEGGDAWEENPKIKQSTAEQIVSLTSIILNMSNRMVINWTTSFMLVNFILLIVG